MFNIYALENTKAQLCVSRHSTSEEYIKNLIVEKLESEGFIVNVEFEG